MAAKHFLTVDRDESHMSNTLLPCSFISPFNHVYMNTLRIKLKDTGNVGEEKEEIGTVIHFELLQRAIAVADPSAGFSGCKVTFLVSTKSNTFIKVLNNEVLCCALGHATMNYLEGSSDFYFSCLHW